MIYKTEIFEEGYLKREGRRMFLLSLAIYEISLSSHFIDLLHQRLHYYAKDEEERSSLRFSCIESST